MEYTVWADLTKQGWLQDGKWNPQNASEENLYSKRDLLERAVFRPLADKTMATGNSVRTIVHAGTTSSKSDGISTNRPDVFLLMKIGRAHV